MIFYSKYNKYTLKKNKQILFLNVVHIPPRYNNNKKNIEKNRHIIYHRRLWRLNKYTCMTLLRFKYTHANTYLSKYVITTRDCNNTIKVTKGDFVGFSFPFLSFQP